VPTERSAMLVRVATRATLLLVEDPAEHALRCWDAAFGAVSTGCGPRGPEQDPGDGYVDSRA
jgi:hypothetical protein